MFGEETLARFLGVHDQYKEATATRSRRSRRSRERVMDQVYQRASQRRPEPPFLRRRHRVPVLAPAIVRGRRSPGFGLGRSIGLRSGENLRRLNLPRPRRVGQWRRGSFTSSSSDEPDFRGGHRPWCDPRRPILVPRVAGRRRRSRGRLIHRRDPRDVDRSGRRSPRRIPILRRGGPIPRIPGRRGAVRQPRHPHVYAGYRDPMYEESAYDSLSDSDSLYSSTSSLGTYSSRESLSSFLDPREYGGQRYTGGYQNRRGSFGESNYGGSGIYETRGGINRVPGLSSRDPYRTGWDGGYHSDGGPYDAGVFGSYHRHRPSLTDESW